MRKILIVEDAAVERELITNILKSEKLGAEYLEAATGEEAIELLGKHYKDVGLILLDWTMPDMDGLELMQSMLKVPSVASIPIVMVTASGSLDDETKARQVNPRLAAYITKPYEPEELARTVRSVFVP